MFIETRMYYNSIFSINTSVNSIVTNKFKGNILVINIIEIK